MRSQIVSAVCWVKEDGRPIFFATLDPAVSEVRRRLERQQLAHLQPRPLPPPFLPLFFAMSASRSWLIAACSPSRTRCHVMTSCAGRHSAGASTDGRKSKKPADFSRGPSLRRRAALPSGSTRHVPGSDCADVIARRFGIVKGYFMQRRGCRAPAAARVPGAARAAWSGRPPAARRPWRGSPPSRARCRAVPRPLWPPGAGT